MKKIFILITIISLALIGCSQELNKHESEPVVEKDLKTNFDNKVIQLKLKETEELNLFKRAIENSKRVPGIADIVNPQYQFTVGEDSFFLWITKASGTIMNTKDTHTIYSLSSRSVKEIYEFIYKDQSENVEEVVNMHMDIQNLEGLNKFVKNVENQNESKIKYIRYGIEGQRGVMTLTFDGELMNVS